jgi:hypothetical protein
MHVRFRYSSAAHIPVRIHVRSNIVVLYTRMLCARPFPLFERCVSSAHFLNFLNNEGLNFSKFCWTKTAFQRQPCKNKNNQTLLLFIKRVRLARCVWQSQQSCAQLRCMFTVMVLRLGLILHTQGFVLQSVTAILPPAVDLGEVHSHAHAGWLGHPVTRAFTITYM